MKKYIYSLIFTAVVFSVCGIFYKDSEVSNAIDIYKLCKREHLLFYEDEIAHEKVFSNIPDEMLQQSALNLGISKDKLEKVLVLQHISKSLGEELTIEDALKLSNREVCSIVKRFIKKVESEHSKEEMDDLKNKLKKI